jgi:ADP-ribose pyrophosphatase
MKYKIQEEKTIFDQFFKIKEAKIEHDSFHGEQVEVTRLCFERGDSVAIVLFEKDTDSFLFTKQFRYPAIKEDGWIVELTAGSIDHGEEPEMAVRREVEEEIGYGINELEFLYSFFVSPGGTSERIFLFYAEVNSTQKLLEGGGKFSEKEDIELVKIKRKYLEEKLKNNLFRDAKTIIGVQWFLNNKKS